MTGLHCPNGHTIGAYVIVDYGAGTGTYCPTCRVSLDNYPDPPPVSWTGVIYIAVGLITVVAIITTFAISVIRAVQ